MLTPLTSYQKKLIAFLSVATFFEGYDFIALAQILPRLRADFGLNQGGGGALVSFINVGTMLAAVLVRLADRWGRKQILSITIVGYTLASLLSAAAPEVYSFAVAQLIARVFLIGEWAVAMVYAAEEFPADRRGMVIGVIQACASLGSVVCAGLVPLLLKAPLGWRTVYVVGALPLALMAVARRGLRESERFEKSRANAPAPAGLFTLMNGPYGARLLVVAACWASTYLCTQTAITFWKEFAVAERGFSDKAVAGALTLAALGSMPLVFFSGRLIDKMGRRMGAVLIFVATSVGIALAYTLRAPWALTAALAVGIFGTSAVLPVLNAFTAELFPTEVRSDAFAWANNILGRVGYVLAPLAVGAASERYGWGPSVASTAIFPLVALAIIVTQLPETRGRELEDTARLDAAP
ncbi:MAG: MFS transporter [Myxococcales bacterium]|nr:MFS transporter [Myxococcales bacterium]